MKIKSHPRSRRQDGYSALFITLVLVGASLLVLAATLSRSTTGAKLNDRNALFVAADGAAEAAVEKVLARMMVDYANYGESVVMSNTNYYQASMLPTAAENPYWTNFVFSDGAGHDNQIYVTRTTSGTNAPYVALAKQFTGLSGYASTYRILANVRVTNTSYGYNFTNAVQQDVQLAQIPVFQFAIFYNGLLEFSDTATFNVRGPVHANSNLYVGSPQNLTFYSIVTSTGNITAPANAGFATSSWTGTVTYNGSPTPGYLTGQPSLTLPIGTNSNSGSNVQQILYPPPSGEDVNSAMGQQRYWNKAGMILWISNNNTYTITLKSSASDAYKVVITNTLDSLTNASTGNYIPWLTVTNTFYDWREAQWMKLSQIDIGKLTNWMATNVYVYNAASTSNKFSGLNPLNIIYVVDYRSTNSTTNTAIRLMDGANLPSAGLTIATPNPIYIWGNYNCPNSSYLGTTNTTVSAPASVAADAVTILSPSWLDSRSTSASSTKLSQTAGNDTVNCAMIAGVVPSTGTSSTTFSGGAMNFPRLQEDWRSATLTLNTSIVCLFNSTWVDNQFQLPGYYYYAPGTRNFAFDLNYTLSSKMPPGTPNICRLIRASWCNPQPGRVDYPDVTQDFVPH